MEKNQIETKTHLSLGRFGALVRFHLQNLVLFRAAENLHALRNGKADVVLHDPEQPLQGFPRRHNARLRVRLPRTDVELLGALHF